MDDIEDLWRSVPAASTARKDAIAQEREGTVLMKRKIRRHKQEKDLDDENMELSKPSEIAEIADSARIPGTQIVYVKTQGCSHNVSDGEYMAGMLAAYGYKITENKDEADVLLYNSCTVKNPSQDTFLGYVKEGKNLGKKVIVAGCVPQGQPSHGELKDLSIVGVQQIHRVVEVVEETLKGNTVQYLGQRRKPTLDLPKIRRNPLIEIVPINSGCLNSCTYCKTKHARGKLSSYDPDAIVERTLVSSLLKFEQVQEVTRHEGVKEVWLTSEDTGTYGRDIGTDLPTLLRRIADVVPSDAMLRLGMTNPPYILEHLEAVAEVMNRPNVYAFLHVPVQSGSNRVLDDMKREYTVEEFKHIVQFLRANVSGGISIATDIICGFPTETEDDFEQTLHLIDELRIPIVNISQFYPRPGTPAAKMKRVPTQIVKDRSRRLTRLFESYRCYDDLLGSQRRVLISEHCKDGKHWLGHDKTYVQVLIPKKGEPDEEKLLMGAVVDVTVTSTEKWCIKAKIDRVVYYPDDSMRKLSIPKGFTARAQADNQISEQGHSGVQENGKTEVNTGNTGEDRRPLKKEESPKASQGHAIDTRMEKARPSLLRFALCAFPVIVLLCNGLSQSKK